MLPAMTTSDDAPAPAPSPATNVDGAAVWETRAGRVVRQLLGATGGLPDGVDAELAALRGEAVPALLAVVDEAVARGDTAALRRAVLWLAALRARAALPTLCRLVVDGAAGGEALIVLARALVELVGPADVADAAVRGALEHLAKADDRAARAFAADAFGALGDPRSRARVQALADDPDDNVQARARDVLRRAADRPAAPAAAAVTFEDFAALAVAAGAGHGGALQPLLDDLADPRRPVRDAAVVALVRAGRAAVPFLLDRLNQPLPRARVAAALALGRLQPPEATGPLLVAATAPAATADEAELRPVALRALAHCLTGAEAGLSPSLLPLTRDPDRFVRAAALLCLGRLAERAGVRAVALALFDDDPFVVESAAIALSEGVREGDVELVLPLLRALTPSPSREPRPAVKEAILIALGRIDVQDAAQRVRVRHAVRADVDAVTASARKAAIVLLERSFAADDPPPLPLVDAVLARTGDAHPDVRVVAASFVARHLPPGMGGAVVTLGRALARRERAVSLLCLEALRRHDTAPAHAALRGALRDDDDVVASRAEALCRDFAPTTTTWSFAPRAVAASRPSMSTPNTAARAARRRTTSTADGRAVVEARFASDDERGG
jgi:HEAT repeat protein